LKTLFIISRIILKLTPANLSRVAIRNWGLELQTKPINHLIDKTLTFGNEVCKLTNQVHQKKLSLGLVFGKKAGMKPLNTV